MIIVEQIPRIRLLTEDRQIWMRYALLCQAYSHSDVLGSILFFKQLFVVTVSHGA